MKDACIQQCLCWSSKTLQADLDKKLQFQDIVQTSLRPDIVIQSTTTKHPNHCWTNSTLGEEVHMKWRKPSTQTHTFCAKSVDGKVGCSQ